ncbi:GyrI-like domain-containing protein [Iodobacter sp. HSC-16F04]|uniref:GyrI-like domain-containing protein n=1 Tax=Iodobacter violaceini TaxID=3044271 RepID=A0ABX0KYZ9_9NEIS|nr:GyrI-like domain-containing protein [Iodobacter violacea]NHQ85458.1 GyrI-like domain-containing protein [Iodobacter violacea]
MKTKQTHAIPVVFTSKQLCLADVGAFATEQTPLLIAEIERNQLGFNGPCIFVYYQVPQDARSLFTLDICFPVCRPQAYAGDFACKTLAPIDCAVRHYQGPLADLFNEGYAPLIAEIKQSGRAFSGESREVYHLWESPQSNQNQIEIQFGLLPNSAFH